jgi:hypothetical protein
MPAFTDGDPNCGEIEIEAQVEIMPGNLLILFDRSLSMNLDFGGISRLTAAQTAVTEALMPFACDPVDAGCEEKLTVGAIMFPSAGTLDICYVEDIVTPEQMGWQSATDFVPAWSTYWATHALVLGTPINPAFNMGAQALASANLSGNTAVLFLTDGAGTCANLPVDAAMQAAAWAAEGIQTHVVNLDSGILAGGGTAFNDAVAAAGGTGASVNPTDSAALSTKLQEVVQTATAVASCDVTLDGGRLTDHARACELGEVRVGAQRVPCDQEAQLEGFYVAGDDRVILVGSACELLQQDGILTAVFPCEVIGPS